MLRIGHGLIPFHSHLALDQILNYPLQQSIGDAHPGAYNSHYGVHFVPIHPQLTGANQGLDTFSQKIILFILQDMKNKEGTVLLLQSGKVGQVQYLITVQSKTK